VSAKSKIVASAINAYLSSSPLRHSMYNAGRILRGGQRRAKLYYRADDPYSHLLVQVGPRLVREFGFEVEIVPVAKPGLSANPAPEMLLQHAIRDAAILAESYSLSFPAGAAPPPEDRIRRAHAVLLQPRSPETQLQVAEELGEAVWRDDGAALARVVERHGGVSGESVRPALDANYAALERAGHYQSGMLHYGGDWYWGIDRWLVLLWDTVLIAFLATLFGFIGAFVLCFPAARNLNSNSWSYFICRRILEFGRSVPELVFALIFVFSFGIGPIPGVLAIALHSCGALGKLFSEINENVDLGPADGVAAAGGNWFQKIAYAVVPQVFPNFMSYTLLRFEINVRAASVVGFVGAGGIGQELMTVIRQFIYQDISAIVLMLVLAVILIDVSCEKLRHKAIGEVKSI